MGLLHIYGYGVGLFDFFSLKSGNWNVYSIYNILHREKATRIPLSEALNNDSYSNYFKNTLDLIDNKE